MPKNISSHEFYIEPQTSYNNSSLTLHGHWTHWTECVCVIDPCINSDRAVCFLPCLCSEGLWEVTFNVQREDGRRTKSRRLEVSQLHQSHTHSHSPIIRCCIINERLTRSLTDRQTTECVRLSWFITFTPNSFNYRSDVNKTDRIRYSEQINSGDTEWGFFPHRGSLMRTDTPAAENKFNFGLISSY